MSRIPVHTLADAPAGSQEQLEQIKKRTGALLNIHAGMAHSPVVLATYKAMSDAIRELGTLDAATREAIALAVGNENGCDYCQSAHTVSAKAAGFSVDQTVKIRAAQIDFDDKTATITAVAREAAANTGAVSSATWNAALAAGWSEDELAEVFAHLALNQFTNYFNHFAETDLDVPAAPALAH